MSLDNERRPKTAAADEADGLEERFWIPPVDDRGNRVDPVFVQAAYALGGLFFRYRKFDLEDDSRRAELIEQAVFRASRAEKSAPVVDPKAYVFKIFARLLDKQVVRERSLDGPAVEEVEELLGGDESEFASSLDDYIWRQQLWSRLSPEMRSVLRRRAMGYRVDEIARSLGVTANTLSRRIGREAERLAKSLRDGEPSRRRKSSDGSTPRKGAAGDRNPGGAR